MKKTFTNHRIAYVFFTIIITCVIISCDSSGGKGETSDPFVSTEFNPYDQALANRVEKYHHIAFPTADNSKNKDVALYIDFSAGMHTAFANPEIKNLLADCFNTVLTDQFEVYQLVKSEVIPLAITNPTELGQKVNDPKEYLNKRAPIQLAVEKIVASNKDALLITDFEEFQNDKEVTNTAYLKISFSKWLAKGNSIHFFVSNYMEGKVTKHIYFTIFNRKTSDAQSLLNKLEPRLSLLHTKFELSNNSFELSNDYPSDKSGGIFYDTNAKSENTRNVLDLKSGYVNGLKKGSNFEFYPLGLDWSTIDQIHESYKEQNQFNDFFRKLYIDLSHSDSYQYGDFEVKVYDISEDFEQFSKCFEAKNHKPKLDKGSNGEAKFADSESDPIALGCYNTDGALKQEWVYKPGSPVIQTEIFTLNQELVKNTKAKDQKKTELGVSFDPKFNVKNIQNPDGLLRVDVVLKDGQPNLSNPTLEQFKWMNVNDIPNTALRESIVSTLNDLRPENKVIYSYYIKTNQ